MKKALIFLTVVLFASTVNAGVKETISNATKGIVKFTKDLSSGVKDGVNEGRSSTESSDGAVVVTNENETFEFIDIELLNVSPVEGAEKTVVELGFKNSHSKPVRITGLTDEGVLLTIDKDGYSHPLFKKSHDIEITVPNDAAVKQTFTFKGDASAIAKVRVWSKTFEAVTKFRNKRNETGV